MSICTLSCFSTHCACPSRPHASHLLFVPHARPAPRLPAHAAPGGRTGVVAPAPSRKCPAERRCRTSCKSSSSVHHTLSACNCAPPCAPQSPLSGPLGRDASASAGDSHPESARHTGLRARGSCCAHPGLWLTDPREVHLSRRSAVRAAEAGLRCVDGSARGASSVSERSGWGPDRQPLPARVVAPGHCSGVHWE